ncbi:hypothetical protein ACJMK2_029712 [Sinanodonta woodiana]|uniref:Uncharacterized protein n=1 Tax=Sinanodonta woodiana TaxID=1069815 RepID=A0ABD3XD19_SINWO
MCDLHINHCDSVSILGDNFLKSERLSCRISMFEIKLNGTRFHDNNHIFVKGLIFSNDEVSCSIPDFSSKHSVQLDDELDTVAAGYKIAIGYERNNFSSDISLLLYDSECVNCAKAGFNISCKIKEEFTIDNLRCVRKSIPSTPNKIDSTKGWIIAVAVGSAVVFLTGLILLGYLLQRKKRNRLKKEMIEKPYQELCKMERNPDNNDTVKDVYDQIADLSDTYLSIQGNAMKSNESTKSECIGVKINTVFNTENDGHFVQRIVVNTDYENLTSKVRMRQSETGDDSSRK